MQLLHKFSGRPLWPYCSCSYFSYFRLLIHINNIYETSRRHMKDSYPILFQSARGNQQQDRIYRLSLVSGEYRFRSACHRLWNTSLCFTAILSIRQLFRQFISHLQKSWESLPHYIEWLFNILDLFADFFNFCLNIDNRSGNLNVLCLRANGICFPVYFLDKKIQLPAYRPIRTKDIP